jgi:hypothetical protein
MFFIKNKNDSVIVGISPHKEGLHGCEALFLFSSSYASVAWFK